MWIRNTIWIFVAAIVAVPISVFGVVKWYKNRFTSLPVMGPAGHVIDNFSLTNQQGNASSIKDWEGKIVVANYFFTHCPVVCPKMTYQLKRVQAYSGVKNLQLASFSVDPERDSVPNLQAFAKRFTINGNWQLLTGNKQQLYRLARKSFMLVATDGDGGPEDFIHSDNLVLIDPQRRIRGYYEGTNEASVNQLIKDIQRLNNER